MYACEGLIAECLEETVGVPGDIAEIGVYRGESALFIAEKTRDCRLLLFDTFRGMPAEMITRPLDNENANRFGDTSLAQVVDRLEKHLDRIDFRQGVFPETITPTDGPFKFVHIDVDLYLSTLAALDFASRRLSPGGRILCDDYCGSTLGAIRAIDEFRGEHPEWDARVTDHRVILRHKET